MRTTVLRLALVVALPPALSAQGREPANYLPIVSNSASVMPPRVGFGEAELGGWHVNPAPITQVGMAWAATAPCTPPQVWRATYTVGWTAGKGPITLLTQDWPWEANRLYVRVCLKLGRIGLYENQPSGTKMMFLSVGDSPGTARCSIVPRVKGNGSVSTMATWPVEISFECAGVLPTTSWPQLASAGRPFRSDVWQVHEWLLDAGSIDRADGSALWWIDGQLVLRAAGLKMRTTASGNTHGFSRWKWAPTWGGTVGTKLRGDDYLIDHVYISGQ